MFLADRQGRLLYWRLSGKSWLNVELRVIKENNRLQNKLQETQALAEERKISVTKNEHAKVKMKPNIHHAWLFCTEQDVMLNNFVSLYWSWRGSLVMSEPLLNWRLSHISFKYTEKLINMKFFKSATGRTPVKLAYGGTRNNARKAYRWMQCTQNYTLARAWWRCGTCLNST